MTSLSQANRATAPRRQLAAGVVWVRERAQPAKGGPCSTPL